MARIRISTLDGESNSVFWKLILNVSQLICELEKMGCCFDFDGAGMGVATMAGQRSACSIL